MAFKEVYEGFVDLNYRPGKTDLVALFFVQPAPGFDMRRAAGAVAAESSVGTWTSVSGLSLSHVAKIAATCFEIKGNWVKVAYPLNNFESGNMAQVYSAIAGNILGMKTVSNIRLQDISFPQKLLKSFPGPQFGIQKLRKIFGIKKRPFLACVPKPKIGMTTQEHAKIGFEVWTGGIDLLKDDENLTSQPFNKFENRVKACMKEASHAERITGERKAGLFNVTAPGKELYRRAKIVADAGNPYVMVDLLTAGWSAVQGLRETCQDLGLALYAHRAFHSAFTRNPRHGVSMLSIAKSARVVGVDNIHVGTGIGKLSGSKSEVEVLRDAMQLQRVPSGPKQHVLLQDWARMRDVVPVSSGGLHPGNIPELLSFLGTDLCIQVGGGVHGHPKGSHAGAVAVREAISAVMHGVSLREAAKSAPALSQALDTWGFKHIK